MKAFVLIGIVVVMLQNTGTAQFQYSIDSPKKLHFNLSYGSGTMNTYRFDQYSAHIEYKFHKNFGVRWNFDHIKRTTGETQFHFPAAPILGGITNLAAFASSLEGYGMLLLMLIPDGISYHFSITQNIEISPYANLLGIDYIKTKYIDDAIVFFAFSFGAKATLVLNEKMVLFAFAETRKNQNIQWSQGVGAGFGFRFGKPEKVEHIEMEDTF